jgi:hypothetical protein
MMKQISVVRAGLGPVGPRAGGLSGYGLYNILAPNTGLGLGLGWERIIYYFSKFSYVFQPHFLHLPRL